MGSSATKLSADTARVEQALGIEEAPCPVCGKSVPVETPECVDGHGPDCPERLCTLCGSALLVHPLLSVVATSATPNRPGRPHSARRAA
jgi:hypothetical protein